MGYKLKRIMMRPNGVEKQVRPSGWKPGANTIAYYPLTATTTTIDQTGNYNLTKQGTVTFTDNYAEFNASGRLDSGINTTATNGTVELRIYKYYVGATEQVPIAKRGTFIDNYRWGLRTNASGNLSIMINGIWVSVTTLVVNTWNCIVYTWEGAGSSSCVQKIYVNGNLYTNQTAPLYNDSGTYVKMGGWHNSYNFSGRLSNVILENKARTIQEVSDYYNQTKANYGL